jgi:hypothetical protein
MSNSYLPYLALLAIPVAGIAGYTWYSSLNEEGKDTATALFSRGQKGEMLRNQLMRGRQQPSYNNDPVQRPSVGSDYGSDYGDPDMRIRSSSSSFDNGSYDANQDLLGRPSMGGKRKRKRKRSSKQEKTSKKRRHRSHRKK